MLGTVYFAVCHIYLSIPIKNNRESQKRITWGYYFESFSIHVFFTSINFVLNYSSSEFVFNFTMLFFHWYSHIKQFKCIHFYYFLYLSFLVFMVLGGFFISVSLHLFRFNFIHLSLLNFLHYDSVSVYPGSCLWPNFLGLQIKDNCRFWLVLF